MLRPQGKRCKFYGRVAPRAARRLRGRRLARRGPWRGTLEPSMGAQQMFPTFDAPAKALFEQATAFEAVGLRNARLLTHRHVLFGHVLRHEPGEPGNELRQPLARVQVRELPGFVEHLLRLEHQQSFIEPWPHAERA
jgi:hypothetical protein